MRRLALVVPLWNQWDYTRRFLESLETAATPLSYSLILVDNGSRDATAKGLRSFESRLNFSLIRNSKNLGCAPAWNQGVRAALKMGAPWIGVLNNDLILSPGIFERMLSRAEARAWDLVSPATREGELNYNFETYADAYTRRCFSNDVEGWFGWCFVVRASVFKTLGLFDEGFKLGIGEDEDFASRMRSAGMKLGVTGSAFLHHFGSKSLNALRTEQGRAWEEENLKKLRGRWGSPKVRNPFRKLGDAMGRLGQRIRWGHLLKE
jgi:GT2 family glycosyltransferase